MSQSFNQKIKQILVLALILFLICISVKELYIFIPGILGAVTLYILSRKNYLEMIGPKKWNKSRAALLLLLFYTLLLGIPFYTGFALLTPKVNDWMNNSAEITSGLKAASDKIRQSTGINLFSSKYLDGMQNKIAALLPNIINATSTLITNFILLLFMLYYLLYYGKETERELNKLIPLKQKNINMLATETVTVVRANAIGIPLISIIQGITATIGYMIFGVKEWALWGFLTAIFAFFPIVGTMIVWVPVVIIQYTIGDTWMATGLLLYSLLVTGNVDYVARITILRKMGNIHPVITVLGVIIGLGLFGFIGLIFGPLLVNYIIILVKIYINEFSTKETIT